MKFEQLPSHLKQLVLSGQQLLRARPATFWRSELGPGKWTNLELLGHLLDSAVNNHQRFVRALSQDSLTWPGYDQVAHVRVQRFTEIEPELLLQTVSSFNLVLANLLAQFPTDKLSTVCSIDGGPAMSLEQLALDYVAHLEHHWRQLLNSDASQVTWSGMPWPPQSSSWPL